MNNLREIAQKFKTKGGFEVLENAAMADRFSFKIGGTTPLLLEPLTEDAFLYAVNELKNDGIAYFILGGGTNIVFSDDGFDGAVISTLKLNKIEEITSRGTGTDFNADGETAVISCQCGALMNTLVNFCTRNGYSGLEQFCGLPGTVGGASYMNARCFDREISDVVHKIEYFTKNDAGTYEKREMMMDKSSWSYKISPFTGTDDIVFRVEFSVKKENEAKRSEIAEKAAGYMKQRVDKGHFKFPCAGSVFKNNRDFGAPSGQIIDEAGLKGYSIGDAQIAPWHGNIIINTGKAGSKDVKALVDYIKAQIKEEKGFELEEEIIFK